MSNFLELSKTELMDTNGGGIGIAIAAVVILVVVFMAVSAPPAK